MTVSFTPSPGSEVAAQPGSLLFNGTNWSTPRTVWLIGQDDATADGDQAFSLLTPPAASTDPAYSSLNPPDVFGTNLDDETVAPPWLPHSYVKPATPATFDGFGYALALSGDGLTLAVGADEDSAGTNAGSVTVFVKVGNGWVQQARLTASNAEAADFFGCGLGQVSNQVGTLLALSTDGNTLAVGAFGEDSAATGIDGNQADNGAATSGAVYVFTRSGTTWTQQAYVKASNTRADSRFGSSLSLSGDGNLLAVGAPLDDSNATGLNGNQADTSASNSGAVYLFRRTGIVWSQTDYVKPSNTRSLFEFGRSTALSSDGLTLAVGAPGESSASTGIDGAQTGSVSGSGAAYLFTRSGNTWAQTTFIKASNAAVDDSFGAAVALNAVGNVLAVGAPSEDSAATGVGGNQADNSSVDSGAMYLFARATAWTQAAYVKATNTRTSTFFGRSVSLSGSGELVAVGSPDEDSSATGVNGNQSLINAGGSGAAYLYRRAGTVWSFEAYLKATNTNATDSLGRSVALDAAGRVVACGASGEDSNAAGVLGEHLSNTLSASGAVYLYIR